jgi:phage replication-related protein YjqB (UPF0714/DUF867 family)
VTVVIRPEHVSVAVTLPTITTHLLERTETGHRTEFLYDDGDNDEVAVCAAHGGGIEPGTGEQAVELAVRLRDATCWACLGYDRETNEFEQFHETSTAIDPGDYPLLDAIADRGFETVLSFHGLADEGLVVGGGIDERVKRLVGERLDDVVTPDARVVSEGQYAGMSDDNFVNWLAAGPGGGLQIEQGPTVRVEESGVVVDVLEDLLASGSFDRYPPGRD